MYVTPRRRFTILLFVFFSALVIAGAVFFVLFFRASSNGKLEIRDSGTGKLYGTWALDEGGEFAVEFIHSVNQSPVRETFIVEDGIIRPLSVRFYSFGAGMQSDVEEGQTLSRDGDALVISGFASSFKTLNYIVGTVSDHLLFINGETVSLRELCGRNAHIAIRYR